MDTLTRPEIAPHRPKASARFGYLVAIAVNAVLLYVANNLLDWGWPPFITEDFDRVVGVVNLSLGASIVFNVVYLAYDAARFKSMGQITLSAITIVASVRLYQVFPFDFSAYEGFPWRTLVRVLLVVAIVGAGIAILAELAKLAFRASRPQRGAHESTKPAE